MPDVLALEVLGATVEAMDGSDVSFYDECKLQEYEIYLYDR